MSTTPLSRRVARSRPSTARLAVGAILVALLVNLGLLAVLRLLQRADVPEQPTYDLTAVDLTNLPDTPPPDAEPPPAEADSPAPTPATDAAPTVPTLPTMPTPLPVLPSLELPTPPMPSALPDLQPLPALPLAPLPPLAPQARPSPAPSNPASATSSSAADPHGQGGGKTDGTGTAAGAGSDLAAPSQVYELDAVDTPPKFLHRGTPVYPQLARELGQEGAVTLRFICTAKGEVRDIKVVDSTSSRFHRSATDHVAGWRFEPAKFRGNAVAVTCQVTIIYHLVH